MELRYHPLMSYRGLPNWPPVWTWRGGGAENRRVRGEVGVLKDVLLSTIEPKSRIFLIVEHENEEYMGCLLFGDPRVCDQIFQVLKDHSGQRIIDIGGLDISHLF